MMHYTNRVTVIVTPQCILPTKLLSSYLHYALYQPSYCHCNTMIHYTNRVTVIRACFMSTSKVQCNTFPLRSRIKWYYPRAIPTVTISPCPDVSYTLLYTFDYLYPVRIEQ